MTVTHAERLRDVVLVTLIPGRDMIFWQVLIKTKYRCPLIYIAFLESSVNVNVMQKWFCVYGRKKQILG